MLALKLTRPWQSATLALAICATAPAELAFAADEEHEVAAEAEEEADHEEAGAHGHGGPFYKTPTFWAAVINFALLLLVLHRLASKPLATYLTDRRHVMERSIEEAAEMRKKAEALHQEYSARLAQLDTELKKLREDIARAAEDDKKSIVADAEETAHRLRRETESLIDQHAKALSASVRREVVEAATTAAEQLLRGTLNDGDQQRLADGFKQSVSSSKTAARAGGTP